MDDTLVIFLLHLDIISDSLIEVSSDNLPKIFHGLVLNIININNLLTNYHYYTRIKYRNDTPNSFCHVHFFITKLEKLPSLKN